MPVLADQEIDCRCDEVRDFAERCFICLEDYRELGVKIHISQQKCHL